MQYISRIFSFKSVFQEPPKPVHKEQPPIQESKTFSIKFNKPELKEHHGTFILSDVIPGTIITQTLNLDEYPTLGSLHKFFDEYFCDNPLWKKGRYSAQHFKCLGWDVYPDDKKPTAALLKDSLLVCGSLSISIYPIIVRSYFIHLEYVDLVDGQKKKRL